MSTVLSELSAVRDAIKKEQPFCTSTYPLTDNGGQLFFLTDGGEGAQYIDLANADDLKLQTLVGACERAAFGLDNKDVLDETYRKAWKMDSSNFLTRLDVVNAGIMDHVCAKLVQNTERKVRSEIYKLNVYGPGSFFKAHKDTPRSENMFASLVVVFPTRHEGGALHFRHKGEEWTFDSATITSAQEIPSIAYVAFYSDVEHEVSMVTSGHRVTLTYNLYYDDTTSVTSNDWIKEDEAALRESLSSLLQNPDVLPRGGYLGFGLDFMYPTAAETKLKDLINSLKGSDAMIKRVLEQLSLNPKLTVIYKASEKGYETVEEDGRTKYRRTITITHVMLDEMDRFPDWQIEEGIVDALLGVGGVAICDADEESTSSDDGNRRSRIKAKKVLWITPLTSFSRVKTSYIAYGNQASLGYSYGNLCLVVKKAGPDFDEKKQAGKRRRVI